MIKNVLVRTLARFILVSSLTAYPLARPSTARAVKVLAVPPANEETCKKVNLSVIASSLTKILSPNDEYGPDLIYCLSERICSYISSNLEAFVSEKLHADDAKGSEPPSVDEEAFNEFEDDLIRRIENTLGNRIVENRFTEFFHDAIHACLVNLGIRYLY